MALKPGEYTFTCGDCDGSGEIEAFDITEGRVVTVDCPDCDGTGEVTVEEDEAEEMIEEGGADPIRTSF